MPLKILSGMKALAGDDRWIAGGIRIEIRPPIYEELLRRDAETRRIYQS
ncbi:hypothetical protein [Rhizobium bangladeshense]|nr:hypothetical protein [Rhizobium bangladeshense]MBX4903662.1 hypothetical protein [Rhizobium bangladeshense]MBX4915062.1 hypothetical protein [Rhizobium bangladeshense]MBX4920039.1 hypothetical protein [Rhizobium bangladeshense]